MFWGTLEAREWAEGARETVSSVCVDAARKRPDDGRGEGDWVLACVMEGDVGGMEPPEEVGPQLPTADACERR